MHWAGRQPIVKTIYNVAIFTLAAAAAAALMAAVKVTRPFGVIDIAVMSAAGLIAGLITYVAVAAVIAVVQDAPLLATWRVSAGLQAMTLAGNLGVACAVIVLYGIDWRLVAALPPIALSLHQGYIGRFRGAAERRAGQRKSVAVSHLTADLDEPAVIRRATGEVCALLTADAVDFALSATGDGPSILYRYQRQGEPWAGRADEATPLPARVVSTVPVGRAGEAPMGELKVWLKAGSADLRLSEWDIEALDLLAMATAVALANARVHAQQTHHATHDRLTGLPIRAVLLNRLQDSAAAQFRGEERHPVALILVDLNGYKDLVISLGHDTAEHLLVRSGAQLRGAVLDGEYLAHIGGDDFGVYLDEAGDPAHVHRRAAALIRSVAEPYRVDAGTVQLGATAGVAYSPAAVLDGPELLRQAVVALNHAHESDLPVAFYDPAADQLGGPAAVVMASELHAALDDQQLDLVYQPVVAVPSKAPVAIESLVRWRHPSRGLLRSAEFMAVLESSPDHGRFVAWQLQQALAARAAWDTDRDLPVSVNLAFACLLDPAFPDQVVTALERVDLSADQLMLEFSETGALTGGVRVRDAMEALRGLGVRIAIDRFGAGSSSMTGLLRLPATHVKIDPDFVYDALEGDLMADGVLRLAVELGRLANLTVVALGVPSEDHLDALVKLGCDAAQGNLLFPATSPRNITEYLAVAPRIPDAEDATVISLSGRRRDPSTS